MKEEENPEETTIPHLFRCPISLELLEDPVTVSTGQTYERQSIQRWLNSCHVTCPVTMQTLPHPVLLTPNLTLRHLIHQWRLTRRLHAPDSGELAAAKLAFLPLLLDLDAENRSLEDADPRRLSSQALSASSPAREILRRVSESERFVSLFRCGSSSTKADLCKLLSPAKDLLSSELLREVAVFAGAGTASSAAGIELLWSLSGDEASLAILAGEDEVVNGVISYLSAGGKGGSTKTEMATEILRRVLAVAGAREALMRNPKGMSALVKRVFVVSGDHRGSESAVAALTWLCGGSPAAKEAAIGAGVLTQLLLLLQSQCNARTKTKARMLLKLLRSEGFNGRN